MPEKQEQSRPVRRLSKTLGLGVKELPSNAAWLVSKAGHKGRSHVPAAGSDYGVPNAGCPYPFRSPSLRRWQSTLRRPRP